MKFLIVFAALFAFTLAAPVDHDEHHGNDDKILSYESSSNAKGYKYSFETSNGIHGDEFGHIDKGHGHGHSHDHNDKHGHEEHDANLHVHGSYAWVDKKSGAKFNIKYTADENGYQPEPIRLPRH